MSLEAFTLLMMIGVLIVGVANLMAARRTSKIQTKIIDVIGFYRNEIDQLTRRIEALEAKTSDWRRIEGGRVGRDSP